MPSEPEPTAPAQVEVQSQAQVQVEIQSQAQVEAQAQVQAQSERNAGDVPYETFGPLGIERLRKDDGRPLILYGLPADD